MRGLITGKLMRCRRLTYQLSQFLCVILMTGQPVLCQDLPDGDLRSTLLAAFEDPPEEIMLHTDRNLYLAGEEILVHAWCRNTADGRISTLSKALYLELTGPDDQAVVRQVIPLEAGNASGRLKIPVTSLTQEYYLRAYTKWMRNYGPGCFAGRDIVIVNPYQDVMVSGASDSVMAPETGVIEQAETFPREILLKVDAASGKYKIREEVLLEISLHNLQDQPVAGKLGIAVVKSGTFSFGAPGHRDPTDWHAQTDGKAHLPETGGVRISGQVIDRRSGKGAAGVAVYMVIRDDIPHVKRSLGDSLGKFSFLSRERYPDPEIMVYPTLASGVYEITMDPQFEPEMPRHEMPEPGFDTAQISLLETMFVNVQVQDRYGKSTGSEKPEAVPAGKVFYSEPDETVVLENFVELPNMEEVFREIIRGVLVLGSTRTKSLQVIDQVSNRTLGPEPCILVNGLPVDNQQMIFDIPPSQVEKIHVVKSRYLLGNWLMDGIIDIQTFDQDFGEISFPGFENPASLRLFGESMDSPVPDKIMADLPVEGEIPEGRIPDFRHVLFWNPGLANGGDGKIQVHFPASDDTGSYDIIVWGLSHDGRYGRSITKMEIRE